MSNEERIAKLEAENKRLNDDLDFLKFKFELLFDNSESSRYIIERGFTRKQYTQIMDEMDEMRKKIDNGEKISTVEFENNLNKITVDGDYHDAEILTRLFMEEGRWEEVFPALYGNSHKYTNYFEKGKQRGNHFAE